VTFLIPLWRHGAVEAYTKVDADVFQREGEHRWRYDYRAVRGYGYALRSEGDDRWIALHRDVMQLPRRGREPQVDHRNHDTLDNRRSNLRLVTVQENAQNQLAHNPTGIRGVNRRRSRTGAWTYLARAKLNYETIHLGSFRTPEEAAIAVEAFRREHMPFADAAHEPT
jgi:hypothetical protein